MTVLYMHMQILDKRIAQELQQADRGFCHDIRVMQPPGIRAFNIVLLLAPQTASAAELTQAEISGRPPSPLDRLHAFDLDGELPPQHRPICVRDAIAKEVMQYCAAFHLTISPAQDFTRHYAYMRVTLMAP